MLHPWYWTGRYTTWNYPGNSGLSTKGRDATPLELNRTLHHLELSWEQLSPRSGLRRYTPGIVQDAIPPGISPSTEGKRLPDYFPLPPSVSAVCFDIAFTAAAAIGKSILRKKDLVLRGYRHTTQSGV